MKTIIIFTIATAINVILSTVRSLCTVKGGRIIAALANAVCYGFYCWVVVLTVADFPLWAKIAITFGANFIGVFAVKDIEMRARKDKMWKVEMTIKNKYAPNVEKALNELELPFSALPISNKEWTVFNCYCKTQANTSAVTDICKFYKGKISAYESQTLT